MNPQIDNYLAEGCGRCPLVSTPECKVNFWRKELVCLRSIILQCGVTEELKWSVPCYTFDSKNILILSAFKEYCSISFFKGSLLKDQQKLLVAPGENSQAARLFKFTSLEEIRDVEKEIKAYIFEAVEIEKAGLKVNFKDPADQELPEELSQIMKDLPELEKAFYSLTPGRQRGYILYFSAPKQSQTRKNRIEKYIPKIMDGLGFHDR